VLNSTELIHTCYYTLGKNSKFVVANKSGEASAERRVEVEVRMRLELGEWLAEIGWVLSVVGVASIESPLTHSKTELRERREQAIQELELCGLRSRN